MPQVDISTVQQLNVQIDALETSLIATPPGPAHDIIAAQVVGLQAQMKFATDQIAKQSDMMNGIFTNISMLTGLGLLGGGGLGGVSPITSIITLFRK
jgi:hypothetical protein